MAFEFDHFDDLRPGRPAPMPRLDPGPGTAVPMPRIDPFAFSGSVGPNGDNRREDVIKAQILLGNSGHYRIAGKGVPTGWPGGELFRSIRAFQKEKGLQADGLLLPPGPQGVDENGVGETLTALQGDLGDKLAGYAAPTPQEVDAYYENEARFSGAPDDGDAATSPSAIFRYDETGPAAHPVGLKKTASARPREIRSDIDPPQPGWQDGQRIAMAGAPPQPVYAPPPPVPPTNQTGTVRPASPYPHEDPTVHAAGQQLREIVNTRLGYAAANMKRWYENGQAFVDGIKRQDLPLNEAEQAAFTTLPNSEATPPSRPMSDADQAATKTPPLVPPNADTKLQGRPAEAPEPVIEKLIPPETKEWIGTLPPQEQPFANDLTGIIVEYNPYGPRGKPETVHANHIAAKVCQATIKEFPRLEGIVHVRGSKNAETNEYQKEEVIKNATTDKMPGHSRPDGTHAHQTNPKMIARFNTVDILKTGSDSIETETMTANEARRYNRLLSNIKEGVAGWARKMRSGETDEDYAKYVTVKCRDMWKRLDEKLEKEGEFGKTGAK